MISIKIEGWDDQLGNGTWIELIEIIKIQSI